MILNQNGNFTTVSQENFTIVELVKKLQAIYPKFKNDNLIVLPTLQEAYDIIEMEEMERDLGF